MITRSISLFGSDATLHHIGLVTAKISDVLADAYIVHDEIQNVSVSFVDLNGCILELIEPATDNSPVSNNLKKGSKFVHLCFEVPDLAQALKESVTNGFRVIANPVPAIAFNGRSIAWVFHKHYGLIELLEK